MSGALKIVKYAMDMELKGQEFYNSFKDKVKNPDIKQLFENFASLLILTWKKPWQIFH